MGENSGKLPFFDLLRGVSSQMVLFGHALNVCFPSVFMHADVDGVMQANPGLFYVQNLGVLIFFCISGFLVTKSVLRRTRRGGYHIQDFLIDRISRIFTPLLPLLVLLFVVDNLLLRNGFTFQYTKLNSDPVTAVLNATMLFDNPLLWLLGRISGVEWLRAGAFGTADQLWTVVVEWWIYVAFGIVYFSFRNRRVPSFGWALLLLFALVVPANLLFGGNALALAWLVGMFGAIRERQFLAFPLPMRVVACAALGVCSIVVLWVYGFDFYSPAFAIVFSSFVVAVHFAFGNAVLKHDGVLSWTVSRLSDISYSVYLVHLSVLFWILAWNPSGAGTVATVVLCVLVSNVVAVVFYLSFERHYPRVRRWLSELTGTDRSPG
jgi:peptidoglycan/LPS O-acetylase OafA/YrhL